MRDTNAVPARVHERRPDRSERELGDAIMESIAVMHAVGSSFQPSTLQRGELLRVARRLAKAVGLDVSDPGAAN